MPFLAPVIAAAVPSAADEEGGEKQEEEGGRGPTGGEAGDGDRDGDGAGGKEEVGSRVGSDVSGPGDGRRAEGEESGEEDGEEEQKEEWEREQKREGERERAEVGPDPLPSNPAAAPSVRRSGATDGTTAAATAPSEAPSSSPSACPRRAAASGVSYEQFFADRDEDDAVDRADRVREARVHERVPARWPPEPIHGPIGLRPPWHTPFAVGAEEERTDLDGDGDDDDRGSAAVAPRINDVLICDGPSASSSSSTSNGAAASKSSSPPASSSTSSSAFHHIGNRRFRVLVEANLSNYFSDEDGDDDENGGEGNDSKEGGSDRSSRVDRRARVAEGVVRSVERNVPSGRFLVRRRREGALGEDERKQSKEGDDNDDNDDDEDDAQCEWRIASPPEVRAKVHATFRAARRFHLRARAAEREAEREAAATEARMRREWESAAAAREAAKEARDRAAEAWARERLAESAARREAAVAGYAAGPPPPGRISAYGYPGAPLDQVAAVSQLWSYDHQRAILAAAAHLRAQERAGERIQSQLQGQSHARNLRQERTRRERIPRGHLGPIRTPHAHDVLLGRGKHANHPGNVRFRKAVEKLRPRYKSVKSAPIKYGDKKQYAKCVVDEVRGLYPPGRFLKEIPKTGLWIEIGDEQAFKKASQALREGRTAAEPGAPPVPSGPVPDPPLDQMAVAAVAQIQTQARQLLMYNEQLAILAAAEQLRAQEQDNRTWQEQVQRKELKRVVAATAELQKKKGNQHSKKRERDESDDDNESLDTPPEAQGAGRRLTQAPFSSATVPPLWQGFRTRLPVGIPRPDPPELRFATTTLDADGGDSDSDASLELAEAGAEEAGDMVWQCNVCSTAEFDSYDSCAKHEVCCRIVRGRGDLDSISMEVEWEGEVIESAVPDEEGLVKGMG